MHSNYIVALSYYIKINGFTDNTQILKGFNKTQNRKLSNSIKILPYLSHICSSSYEATLFRVAYSISFCDLQRVGEIAFSKIDHINHV